MTLKQLRDAHAKNPNDADIAARLAEKNYALGKRKDAKELAEKVLRNMPRHPAAAYVKARTLLDEKRFEDAYSLLDSVATDELKETKPLELLVKMQYDAKKYAQAARTAERARKIDPHDPSWIVQLAKIYVKTDQKDKLLKIYEEVAKIDPDDLGPRKTLARHYLDLGKHAQAERYARMGLEIDVLDAECQRIILQALTALNRQEEADRLRKVFGL
jgi:tetratricopeptide (TPR) repeat protein